MGRRRLPIVVAAAVLAAAAGIVAAADGAADELPRHSPEVERWRPLVERYWTQYGYGDEVDYALMVMFGESWGVPTAQHPDSRASGLFQHLPRYWPDRSVAAGWAGADIFDPEANIAVAAWLRATSPSHGWRHWEATHVWYPPGSFGPDTHWDGRRYVNMGGGHVSRGGGPVVTDPPPRLELSKGNGRTGEAVGPGDTLIWVYEITNPGDDDLWSLYLWDDALGELGCASHLPAGETVTCIATQAAEPGSVSYTHLTLPTN